MRKYKIAILPLFAILNACATHYDCSTTFIFSGSVASQSDSKGIEGAKISFVDTGYDSVHSKKQQKHEIGSTDIHGKIIGRFDYWWGYEKGIFRQEPKETFDVVIEKPGYHPKAIHFNKKNQNPKSREVQVDIGKVEMDRSNDGFPQK